MILLVILTMKLLAGVSLIPFFRRQVIMLQAAGWSSIWLIGVVFLGLTDGSLNYKVASLGFWSSVERKPISKGSLCICMLRHMLRIHTAL